MNDDIWTPERIAMTRQLAEDTGTRYIGVDRGTYRDIPVARNDKTGREAVYHNGYDLWENEELKKYDQPRDVAIDWLK